MNIKIKLSFLFCHIFSKVFYMWINGTPVCLYCSKPFVSYPLVVSYPQQCHIGTNENYLCAIIISTHMLVFEISHSKTLSNFNKLQPQLYLIQNKQIDYIRNIMSKCLHVFITSFSAFFLKCSKNQRKLCQNFNLRDFRRSSFGDYIHVTLQQLVNLILNILKYFTTFILLNKLFDLEQFHI